MARDGRLEDAVADLRDHPEAHLPELFGKRDGYTVSTVRYFEYYGLDVPGRAHDFGVFEHGSHRLAGHVIRPPNPRGTVVALHGYLDHAGIHRSLVHRLSAAGYTVALFDLPGHGLSSGERASIGDFKEYAEALQAYLDLCRGRLETPFHLLGHSTGGAVILDHVLTRRPPTGGCVVLVAPLVRSYAWHVSGLGQRLTGLVARRVARVFRSNSSDREFLRFVRRDPLQPRWIPLSWRHALCTWIERMKACPPSDREVLVVQGTRDTTVDWRYNGPFLRRKLPRAKIELVEGGRHHLLNEARPMRDEVLDRVVGYLDARAAGG